MCTQIMAFISQHPGLMVLDIRVECQTSLPLHALPLPHINPARWFVKMDRGWTLFGLGLEL